ncbi:MAG: polyketide synthase, partial [Deltaproteobacteria bacterium]|nr:polyketide synthase [Deltaproteobacteria bacterium]
PDKSYTKIGGFSTNWTWDPLAWKLPIPPKVSAQMDRGQKWAIMAARQALLDYGLSRPLDRDRTGVILGNAMAGDRHYYTALRILTPEIMRELQASTSFAALAPDFRAKISEEVYENVRAHFPPINEDTMPGELSNIIAGRVASLFDLHGPSFVTDAACASAMAALSAACEGLTEHRYDAVLSGGVDANMNPASFIKFCKIGALSATGSRPYDADADGFVMGEGGAVFLLKRLADAERDQDKIYAVNRGIGASSDGKGKGITAPNPIGQELAVARGWENAGIVPNEGTMIEGHGTSTRVGDVAEGDCLMAVLPRYGLKKHSIPLGSVKSNIGHLKAGAGAAGLFKAALSLHEKT